MTDQTISRDLGGFPGEPDDLFARNMWAGTRLWIAADLFFFFAFGFAFFYLRALNSNGGFDIRHSHQQPSTALGVVVLILTLVTAATAFAGHSRLRAGNLSAYVPMAAVGLIALIAAIVVQCWQFGEIGLNLRVYFGYASVYIGWAIFFVLHLLGCAYWQETMLAQAVRKTGRVAAMVPNAEAFAAFYAYLTGVGIIMFVLLYLMK